MPHWPLEDNGYGVVDAFQESAYYGTAEANNGLQFLGEQGSANIRFVSNAGDSLGIDTSTDPKVTGFASSTINLGVTGSSIQISARTKGEEYDDVSIIFKDAGVLSAGWRRLG